MLIFHQPLVKQIQRKNTDDISQRYHGQLQNSTSDSDVLTISLKITVYYKNTEAVKSLFLNEKEVVTS